MVSWGMAKGSIGIGAAPGKDGSAIDDEIASADEPSMQGQQHGQHEETFKERSPSGSQAFALLGGARDARATLSIQG